MKTYQTASRKKHFGTLDEQVMKTIVQNYFLFNYSIKFIRTNMRPHLKMLIYD